MRGTRPGVEGGSNEKGAVRRGRQSFINTSITSL